MDAVPNDRAPRDRDQDHQGGERRPAGVGHPTFGEAAARLVDNGFEPLPIKRAQKAPAVSRWSTIPIDAEQVQRWSVPFGPCGIGLRTGRLIGIDIDSLDPDLAHQIAACATTRFGPTLVRVGLWPKRLLLYRTEEPFAKLKSPQVEILGAGQQFVTFGIHPVTGQPYHWPEGETPLDVDIDDLPLVDADSCNAFLAEASSLIGHVADERRPLRERPVGDRPDGGPIRNSDGLVVDGRDAWMSSIAFHTVHDAAEQGKPIDPEHLTARTWERFAATTDLARGQKDGPAPWSPADAARKVRDKLALQATGRLPPRDLPDIEPDYPVPMLSVEEARGLLDAMIADACARIAAWHSAGGEGPSPQIGICATVGLGKSVAARRHLKDLSQTLRDQGLPHGILVVTPSHVLARETARSWSDAGMKAAVLHGYEALHPISREPMCRDLDAVRAAISTGKAVPPSVCSRGPKYQCDHLEGCLKRQNRLEIANADVVVAPYDALFTGVSNDADRFGAILIDEGCWARAVRLTSNIWVESFDRVGIRALATENDRQGDAMADLAALRTRARAMFFQNGPGLLRRQMVLDAGFTLADCAAARELEIACLQDPNLFPGMAQWRRPKAFRIAQENATILQVLRLWGNLGKLIGDASGEDGRIRILPPNPTTGLHEVRVMDMTMIHDHLARTPILHLDATLRDEIARTVLPRLEVQRIEVAAPHMALHLVTGSFGKSALCADPRASREENQRRQNRLSDVVDYVRWQARRFAGEEILVITYKDCEAAFRSIANVHVAHFNAIAGLDSYKHVRLLIVVGRPLPSEAALVPLSGSIYGRDLQGGYRSVRKAVHMRGGGKSAVRVIGHVEAHGEAIRAAICDDEVIQAIGRGRGVNRTAETPLDVHVLGRLALPLVHDSVTGWEAVCPDIFQQMLLAGVAVDSPTDAAALHPDLFDNEKQVQKVLERSGFKRHFPIRNSYREMSLKSARYRRAGRGRSWQMAWWLDGDPETLRLRLQNALGRLDGWKPLS